MIRPVAALLAASICPAHAQDRIQPYGAVDQALQWAGDAAPGRWTLGYQWGDSRFGIRGHEPIAERWRARFALENRFAPDTGRPLSEQRFWNAQSWVGVEGPGGALRIGRDYTPLDQALGASDCADQGFYYDNAPSGMTSRADAMVQWRADGGSPLTATLARSAASGSAPQVQGAAIVFDGPLLWQAAVQRVRQAGARQTEHGAGVAWRGDGLALCASVAGVWRDSGPDTTTWQLGGRRASGRHTTFWALRHESHEGTPATGLGLAYLRALSARTYVYGAAGTQISPRWRAPRVSIGMRTYF